MNGSIVKSGDRKSSVVVEPRRAVVCRTPDTSIIPNDNPVSRPGERLLVRMNITSTDIRIVIATDSRPSRAVEVPQCNLAEEEFVRVVWRYNEIMVVNEL